MIIKEDTTGEIEEEDLEIEDLSEEETEEEWVQDHLDKEEVHLKVKEEMDPAHKQEYQQEEKT